MSRMNIVALVAVAVLSALATFLLATGNRPDQTIMTGSTYDAEDETERGPHGGWLLEDGDFAIELAIVEAGIPPEFHLYAFDNGQPLTADRVSASVELGRLGGIQESFTFVPEGAYLRAVGIVHEPHSFDVDVTAKFAGKTRKWHFESYEGRTQIPQRIAAESGIRTEPVGTQRIIETIELTGTVQANPARVSEVRARFPGIVTEVLRDTGDYVSRGDRLAYLETNESLRSVSIDAPISGLLVTRNIQVGQVSGDEPLFVIADLSEVWVQLDVFGRDLGAIEAGQSATVSSLDGSDYGGTIDWVSPLVAHGSQSVRARVPLANPDGTLRAGQFVRAQVTIAETEVPLAVRRSALQTFRDFDVVYAQVGDAYEVRMLEIGRHDENFVEVLDGLTPGEIYVTENSYLVKADIEKSGASHNH